MLVPDESITAWVDVSGVLDARWAAIKAHVTQISDENPFVRFGKEAWREFWNREAFIRRESRVPAPDHETDLFAGLDGQEPGPTAGRTRAWRPARRAPERQRACAAGLVAVAGEGLAHAGVEVADVVAGLRDDLVRSRCRSRRRR